MNISGHELEFYDCHEERQGGPVACSLLIDREQIEGKRFDQSPLGYRDGILIPARVKSYAVNGYALYYIDPTTLRGRFVSKVLGYIRLLKVSDDVAEVITHAGMEKTAFIQLTMDPRFQWRDFLYS